MMAVAVSAIAVVFSSCGHVPIYSGVSFSAGIGFPLPLPGKRGSQSPRDNFASSEARFYRSSNLERKCGRCL